MARTDEEETDRATLISDLLAGQYSNPVRIIAFNTAEGWSRRAARPKKNQPLPQRLLLGSQLGLLLGTAFGFGLRRRFGADCRRVPIPAELRLFGCTGGALSWAA